MPVARPVQLALLLLLVVAPISVPGLQTTSYGGWPAVGFATALVLLAGRAHRWTVLLVLTLVVSVALTSSYGVPLWQGVFGSLSVTLPALVCAWMLQRHGHDGLPLEEVDVGDLALATVVSALVCALFGGLVVLAVRDLHAALLTALMSFLAALTAQLVVLPLLTRSPRDRAAAAEPPELWIERVLLLVVTAVVFVPQSGLGAAFVVFPLLGWAALRASRLETHVQLFVVAMIAYVTTFLGHGPFSHGVGELPGELMPMLLYLFVAAACFLTVPVALTVERLVTVTAEATRVAATVERMLNSATNTVFIGTDRQGRITHFNTGAEQTLGYTRAEVLGASSQMFHTEEEIARQAEQLGVSPTYADVVLAQLRSGERRDWQFRRKDGATRMGSLTITALSSPSGTVHGYIASGEDITERLRAQGALEAALDREHVSLLRLQEADQVKQELVSTVSHELRTPITSISGYTEVLVDGALGDLNPGQSDALARIERNAARLGVLVDDLLTLSREESDDLLMSEEEIDLREVVHETGDVVAGLARDRALDVRLLVPQAPVMVRGDVRALERAATNLISNAVKFTPDGGVVSMRVEATTSEAVLLVSDNGIGIPEHEQDLLFTRFFRAAAASREAIQGSGLGLSIVHAIVTRHGGTVSVESQPGVGTTVRAALPLLGAH